jgi:DNA-binding IclR family transcriptional regulator
MKHAAWQPTMPATTLAEGVVKSAGRVMAILEIFDLERRDLTIGEIVLRLGIPQSSASMLMRSLLRQGYVDYDPVTRAFRPSMRVAMLGGWVLGSPEKLGNVLTLMQQLYDATGETILAGAEHGQMVQYVNVIESQEALRFAIRPGLMRPIHLSNLGIVLLAQKPDAEIARIVQQANGRIEDPAYRHAEAEVLEKVRRARADGCYQAPSMVTPGAAMLGALLRLPDRARPLAIGIGAPRERLERRGDFLRRTLLDAVASFA